MSVMDAWIIQVLGLGKKTNHHPVTNSHLIKHTIQSLSLFTTDFSWLLMIFKSALSYP